MPPTVFHAHPQKPSNDSRAAVLCPYRSLNCLHPSTLSPVKNCIAVKFFPCPAKTGQAWAAQYRDTPALPCNQGNDQQAEFLYLLYQETEILFLAQFLTQEY